MGVDFLTTEFLTDYFVYNLLLYKRDNQRKWDTSYFNPPKMAKVQERNITSLKDILL